ncbi:MAG: response regulator [Nitrospina sp.]|nr:response regulator [Nitrospina sp.]
MNRTLLIVDDEPNVIKSLKRQLRRETYDIYSAESGPAGLDLLNKHSPAVVLSDQMMPGMDGIAFLASVKEIKPDAVRILLTGHGTLESAMNAIKRSQIFEYLTKPWSDAGIKQDIARAFERYDLVAENRRLHKMTREQNKQLKFMNDHLENLVQERTLQFEEAMHEGIIMLAAAAEARDDDTGGHIRRVRTLTHDICRGLGMPPEECKRIGFFSIMHDVGKIHIADSILKKPGQLSAEEWKVMQTHTIIGEKILSDRDFYGTAREIARSHHENWDGTGYPDRLMANEIPLSARVVAVADVFDAMSHKRVYKKAMSEEKVRSIMKDESGRKFDPEILGVFLGLNVRFPEETYDDA